MRKLELVRVKLKKVIDGVIKLFEASGHVGQTVKGEFPQQYGLTSRPRGDTDGLVLQVANGSFLIATGDKEYYVEIDEGEVCLHASPDVKIHLKADDTIEVTGAGVKFFVNGDMMAEVSGDMTAEVSGTAKLINSKVEIGESSLQAVIQSERFKAYFDAHTHMGNLGAPTSPPLLPMPPSVLSAEVKTGG